MSCPPPEASAEASAAPFAAEGLDAALEDRGKAAAGRYLLFGAQEAGTCALPIGAVLAVAAPDGAFHSVPGSGGGGSRFLGMVSVRGQVQLGFDLTRRLPAVQRAWQLPLGESLLVVTAGGRTAALRVAPPLRLAQTQALAKASPSLPPSWLDALAHHYFYETSAAAAQPALAVRLIDPGLLLDRLEKEVGRG